MSKVPVFVGIDPGLSGAVAYLLDGALYVFDMPVERDAGKRRVKERVNAAMLLVQMRGIAARDTRPPVAVIETVASMPGQGVSSVFSLGDSFGVVRACCLAAGVACNFAAPARWKKEFGLLGSDKDASRTRASELFPQCADIWPLKKHHGRAEAALLAEFSRRLYGP